jgi:hypothetical protein
MRRALPQVALPARPDTIRSSSSLGVSSSQYICANVALLASDTLSPITELIWYTGVSLHCCLISKCIVA